MKPDFSGEYFLDRPACALSAAAGDMATAWLRIEHDEPRIRCAARFATTADAVEFTFERITDGREVVVSAHESSRCHWDNSGMSPNGTKRHHRETDP